MRFVLSRDVSDAIIELGLCVCKVVTFSVFELALYMSIIKKLSALVMSTIQVTIHWC